MTQNSNKILVPIDFQEPSLNALDHSYELARLFDAELILLYVIEVTGVFGKLRSPEGYVKNVIKEAREKFDELEKLAGSVSSKASVKVTTIIEKGKPYDRIINTAIDNDVILIIMGKSGVLDTPDRKFIGSNTLNVIRDAPCPVITVKGDKPMPEKFANILLPLDFTGHTKKQVQKAIDLGGYFGSSINIISVVSRENKVTKLLKQVQMNQVKNAINRHGIRCHSELLYIDDKSAAEEVIDYSMKMDADLIIIMTQQKKSIIHYYVGSTALQIIQNSEIPVLSIFPAAEFKPGMVTSMVDPMGLMRKKDEE
jgi:nucleotide-binding universal stress UspA family protein